MEARRVCILFAVTALMIFLYGGIDYTSEPYSGWDLSSYRTMAAAAPAVAKDVGKPFAHRLLGPYLAGLAPMPDPAAFQAISVVVSFLLVGAFYFFLRRRGLSANVSLITAILLTFNKHWFGFTAWDYFQVNDVLSLLFILAMLWSMLEERWWVFGLALSFGALTKETSMLMVPVAMVYLLEKRVPARTWGSALVAMFPGVAVFVAIRMLVPAPKGVGPFEAFLAHWDKLRSPERALRLLLNSWLPVSLIPLAAAGAAAAFFRRRKWALALAALVLVGALCGANDERLMAPVFAVAYYFVGVIMEDLGLDKRAIALVLAAGFASSFHHIFARYPLPGRGFTLALSLAAAAVVAAVIIYRRLARSGPTPRMDGETP